MSFLYIFIWPILALHHFMWLFKDRQWCNMCQLRNFRFKEMTSQIFDEVLSDTSVFITYAYKPYLSLFFKEMAYSR